MTVPIFRLASLVLACQAFLAAQPADDTQLKQVILFGRHGVRTPNSPNSVLNNFSVQAFPVFPDVPGNLIQTDNPPSVLTINGATNETLLGGYFRLWLTQEGLLTGNDAADAANVYFRADGAPLITGTAQAFAAGLLPAATVKVNSILPLTSDPLFDPIDAGVALLDEQMAMAAVNGRLGGNPPALTSAYSAELALIRSVMFNYPAGQAPAPAAPAGKFDVTSMPISVAAGSSALPVNLGGMETVALAIDPFVMEYTDGLPASQVAWGQLTAGGISQVFRVYDRLLDLEFRTPYLAKVQSSNLASHIVRTLVQASTGNTMTGTIGNPSSKVIALIGSNTNIVGFAGLFHLDWLLPGYQADVAAPGGILMFELRQSQGTGEYIVRTSYVAQTMDQLRNRTGLTLAAPPPIASVFIPGCSIPNATFDCPLARFVAIANQVIDPHSADLMN
jgi:4-phytase / acid phosphatase